MMSPCEAVLAAARVGVDADTAGQGFGEIRALAGVEFSDAQLAEAIATAIREGLVQDPVRLLLGQLQCCWRLELFQRELPKNIQLTKG